MPSCPPPGPLSPPTGIPTVDFLGGKLKMQITNLWTKAKGWQPTSYTRVYTESPEGKAITAKIYALSKQRWRENASSSDHRPITEVIKSTRWARSIHGFTVKLPVKPGETVSQYKARGGYLLWQDYFDDDTTAIDEVRPSWIGSHDPIDGFRLGVRVRMWTKENTVPPHTIRPRPDLVGKAFYQVRGLLITPGRWDRAMDWVVNKVRSLCGKLTSDKMQRAAAILAIGGAAASATGVGEVAIAAAATYQAIAAACGVAWPDCPAVIPPKPPTTTPSPSPNTTMVTRGTIAWFDKRIGLYRLAQPMPLAGLKATYIETTTVSSPPGGVEVVNRIAWESVTRPFYRRTTFLVGSAAATLAAVGAALAIRHSPSHR